MLGFIKKDMLMLKNNLLIFGIIYIIYIIMAFKGQMDIFFIPPFLSVMIMMSTFSYDNYNKWEAYAMTLPNGRKNIVRSKYVATLLLIISNTLIASILSIIISYISSNKIDYTYILASSFGTIIGTALVLAIIYPLIFKLGIEKARIIIFVLVFGVILGGGLLIQYIDLSALTSIFKIISNYYYLVLSIAIIAILYISYKISMLIYHKKEF